MPLPLLHGQFRCVPSIESLDDVAHISVAGRHQEAAGNHTCDSRPCNAIAIVADGSSGGAPAACEPLPLAVCDEHGARLKSRQRGRP